MDKEKIEEILQLVRSANQDEFNEQLTDGVSLENLLEEVKHLVSHFSEHKKKLTSIIEHLSDCFSGNFFNQVPISEKGDELDVLSMGFNTYIEELEDKTVSRNYILHVLNVIPEKIMVFDKNGKIDLVNSQNNEFFKYDKDEVNLSIENILPKDILEEIKDFRKSKNSVKNFEILLNKNSKNSIPLWCTLLKIDSVKKDHILFVAKDITEQKNEENKIMKATFIGQEEERKRVAHDLHDSLGQELNAVKMYLGVVKFMEYNSPKYNKTMEDAAKLLNDAIDSVKNISFNLMPVILENNCLSYAISQLVDRTNLIANNVIFFDFPKDKELGLEDKKDELFVYRVIQEFINNSLKYAKASELIVKLWEDKKLKTVNFSLTDNGIGFDMKASLKQVKNGVNNMQQRLKTLKADYTYKSQLGKGTTLEFTLYK